MKHNFKNLIGAFLCLSVCVSCHKREEPVVAPIKETTFTSDGFIGLDKLMPELVTLETIKYDEQMGYYVYFPQDEWEKVIILEPSYIPSQSIPCSFKATRTAIPESSGWDANVVRQIVLEDIVVSCFYDTDIVQAACDAVFKMRMSLGENVPYRKVTLTDFEVAFPEWFRAKAESSISELEVTAEGTVVSFRLNSIQDPDRFLNGLAQLCYNLDVSFRAHASVRPEDYIGPASDTPSELEFCCDFEFDRIDFTTCGLRFGSDDYIGDGRASCMSVFPSPFPGVGSEITFTSPRLLIDYRNEIPFTSASLNVEAFFDDHLKHEMVEFTLTNNGKYLFMPKDDGVHREGIQTVEIEAMGKMNNGPFFGEHQQAMLFLQPEFSTEGTFMAGQEYRMHMAVEWWLPLAFVGTPNITLETPSIELNSKELGAWYGYTHELSQEIRGDLPFDCQITPVFTFEREEPIFLDSFVLDKNTSKKVVYQFTPSTAKNWKATFHYLITPTQGKNVYFTKDYGLTVENTVFTANIEKNQ